MGLSTERKTEPHAEQWEKEKKKQVMEEEGEEEGVAAVVMMVMAEMAAEDQEIDEEEEKEEEDKFAKTIKSCDEKPVIVQYIAITRLKLFLLVTVMPF